MRRLPKYSPPTPTCFPTPSHQLKKVLVTTAVHKGDKEPQTVPQGKPDLMVPPLSASVSPAQEMMDIVKAIYDMMGKYTYPVLKEDTPRQHVDVFFQVSVLTCV